MQALSKKYKIIPEKEDTHTHTQAGYDWWSSAYLCKTVYSCLKNQHLDHLAGVHQHKHTLPLSAPAFSLLSFYQTKLSTGLSAVSLHQHILHVRRYKGHTFIHVVWQKEKHLWGGQRSGTRFQLLVHSRGFVSNRNKVTTAIIWISHLPVN